MTTKYPIQPEEIGPKPKGAYLSEADARITIDRQLHEAGRKIGFYEIRRSPDGDQDERKKSR